MKNFIKWFNGIFSKNQKDVVYGHRRVTNEKYSCEVRGLLKILRDENIEWVESSFSSFHLSKFKCPSENVDICLFNDYIPSDCQNGNSFHFHWEIKRPTAEENTLIFQEIKNRFPNNKIVVLVNKLEEENRKKEETKRRMVELGCPENNS